MRSFFIYCREYLRQLNLTVSIFIMAMMTVLIVVNYSIGIESKIVGLSNRYMRFLSFFFLFSFIFSSSYLFIFAFTKKRAFNTRFYLLLVMAPALFALKMSLKAVPEVLGEVLKYPDFDYWKLVLNWPVKMATITASVFVIWKLYKIEAPFGGLIKPYGGLKAYLLLLACMIPILAIAAATSGFQEVYPRVQAIFEYNGVSTNRYAYLLIYELCYGLDFFTIELFFRGFLILGFMQYVGKDAILPMAAFYCAIHFGKPVAECISSFFGGMALGAVVYYTRSIWGGFLVHLGVAWSMEVIGMLYAPIKVFYN